jgi:hypothetical protein
LGLLLKAIPKRFWQEYDYHTQETHLGIRFITNPIPKMFQKEELIYEYTFWEI